MKKIIAALFLSIFATFMASAVTIVCTNVVDFTGAGYGATSIQWKPIQQLAQPQNAYNGATVVPAPRTFGITNNAFTNTITQGGFYSGVFYPQNLYVQPVNILVPSNDTNTYTLNQVMAFAQTGWAVLYGTNVLMVTNGSTAGAVTTNQLSSWSLLVCPWTNNPQYPTNNPFVFTPMRGSNYVQQAVWALQYYGQSKQVVGGGQITVIGTNYLPSTLKFTNTVVGSDFGVNSYHLTSPTKYAGALVCATNPCIDFTQEDPSYSMQAHINIEVDSIIIASLQNYTNNLFVIPYRWGNCDIHDNWFGPWQYITNTSAGNFPVLVTPNLGDYWLNNRTALDIPTNNLIIFLDGDQSEWMHFDRNHLTACGVYVRTDHMLATHNLFENVGRYNDDIETLTSLNVDNGWPKTSPYSLGGCFYLNSGVKDLVFQDNAFVDCKLAYSVLQAGNSDVRIFRDHINEMVGEEGGDPVWYMVSKLTNDAPIVVDPRAMTGVYWGLITNPANVYGIDGTKNMTQYGQVFCFDGVHSDPNGNLKSYSLNIVTNGNGVSYGTLPPIYPHITNGVATWTTNK